MESVQQQLAPKAPVGVAEGEARSGPALDPVKHLYANEALSVEELLRALGVHAACERPLLMENDTTGELVQVRCRSRRAADCASCSALYQGDASAILRAGALDVDPGSVIVMLTLTAPSFGAVHRVPKSASPRLSDMARAAWQHRSGRCRCRCGVSHAAGDALAGVPLDLDRYDHDGQAAWNEGTGKLWNRTATRLKRDLALPQRLAYAGTAELQTRGAVHFHLLVRLPAATGLGLQRDKVGRLRSRLIEEAVLQSSATVGATTLRWGTQVVAEVIAAPGDGGRHARRSIGYLRKALAYTVKDVATGAGTPSAALTHATMCHGAARRLPCPHCKGTSVSSCRSPRRAFGYSGHPLRKSRCWSSVTFGLLRARRSRWCESRDGQRGDDPERMDSWTYGGVEPPFTPKKNPLA